MSNDTDTQTRQSWELARGFSKLLLPAPPQLKDANELLWKAHLQMSATGKPIAARDFSAVLKRVQPIAKLTTPIYFAAATMFPDQIQQMEEDDTLTALLQILQPGLFSTIITLVYLHRRLNKIIKEIESPRMLELWRPSPKRWFLTWRSAIPWARSSKGLAAPRDFYRGRPLPGVSFNARHGPPILR